MTELPENHAGTAERAETAPWADHVAAGRLRAASGMGSGAMRWRAMNTTLPAAITINSPLMISSFLGITS